MTSQTYTCPIRSGDPESVDKWRKKVDQYLNKPPHGMFVRDTHFSTNIDSRGVLYWSLMVVYDDIPTT